MLQAHSTLILDNTSVCGFKKDLNGNLLTENEFKLFNKKIVNEKIKIVMYKDDEVEDK